MSPAIHEIKHVTHIDIDGASQLTVEEDVAGQRVPVAIERQTEQFALSVEDRRAAVATRDVVVRQEAQLQGTR